jgi:hypothetical protein
VHGGRTHGSARRRRPSLSCVIDAKFDSTDARGVVLLLGLDVLKDASRGCYRCARSAGEPITARRLGVFSKWYVSRLHQAGLVVVQKTLLSAVWTKRTPCRSPAGPQTASSEAVVRITLSYFGALQSRQGELLWHAGATCWAGGWHDWDGLGGSRVDC